MSQSQESVRLSPRRSPRSPSFPTASKTDVPDTPSILAFQRCLRHFLYILYQSMGRFPELTPVRSQTTRPWLSTLDAGDITLLLEWASTSTRGPRRKKGDRPHLEGRNERRGTRSPQVVGREAPWLGGVRRRRGWCAGNLRSGS